MRTTVSNIARFDRGFAGLYHAARPALNIEVVKQLVTAARGRDLPSKAELVVADVGCGTGLSTVPWSPHALRVIGVEPATDMRRIAEQSLEPCHFNVAYREGTSEATGLAARSVDIVTVSQALHWMNPQPTFAEAARVLKQGGVFIAYDCDWPPVCGPAAEQAYDTFMARAEAVESVRNASEGVVKRPKQQHASNMLGSGAFFHVRDVVAHQTASGTAEALVQIGLSQGSVQAALAAGATDAELGIPAFRSAVENCFGGPDVVRPWMWSYRVRLGVMPPAVA